jgi:hypothetical protein
MGDKAPVGAVAAELSAEMKYDTLNAKRNTRLSSIQLPEGLIVFKNRGVGDNFGG